MTVTLAENAISLRGACGVEEVENLLSLIDQYPKMPVDLEDAMWIHTALWQVLLMAEVKIRGTPASSFASGRIIPILRPINADG